MARILFVAALALTLFMALDPLPPHVFLDRYGDKIEHMSAFGVLAGLARFAFPRVRNWLLLEHISFLGAMIEVIQATHIVHRDCDWKDWVADTVAATVALVVLKWLVPRVPFLQTAMAGREG